MNVAPFPGGRIRAMPKAELHVHLEGTVAPRRLLSMAKRAGVSLPAGTPEEVRGWLVSGSFERFLERYLFTCDLLTRPADFREVARDYLVEARSHGAVHVEFHISLAIHLHRKDLSWPVILEGIAEGCDAAEEECGISSLLIPDVAPMLSAVECLRVAKIIAAHPHPRVVALGMGGPGRRWREEDFSPVFECARQAGLRVVSHAGEHGPPWEIRHVVEVFGVDRIQHGIQAVRDPEVLALVRERAIPCDVCPGSNVALGAVRSWPEHPLPEMIAEGLTCTLSTDDPPFCQTDLTNEYRQAWEVFELGEEALAALARNSLEGAFAAPERKAAWKRLLDDWQSA